LSFETDIVATTGTVMLAALPIILGIQFLLSFISYDMASSPGHAIHPLLDEPAPDRLEMSASPHRVDGVT
jgi:hypothetical protein